MHAHLHVTNKPALAVGRVEGNSVAIAKISGDLVRLETGGTGTDLGMGGLSLVLSAPDRVYEL